MASGSATLAALTADPNTSGLGRPILDDSGPRDLDHLADVLIDPAREAPRFFNMPVGPSARPPSVPPPVVPKNDATSIVKPLPLSMDPTISRVSFLAPEPAPRVWDRLIRSRRRWQVAVLGGALTGVVVACVVLLATGSSSEDATPAPPKQVAVAEPVARPAPVVAAPAKPAPVKAKPVAPKPAPPKQAIATRAPAKAPAKAAPVKAAPAKLAIATRAPAKKPLATKSPPKKAVAVKAKPGPTKAPARSAIPMTKVSAVRTKPVAARPATKAPAKKPVVAKKPAKK